VVRCGERGGGQAVLFETEEVAAAAVATVQLATAANRLLQTTQAYFLGHFFNYFRFVALLFLIY
jgi:hypothetical protein